jgi:hypothetical protein
MKEEGPFEKQISIRLAEDGTGFLYTVSYGWLRLPIRHVQVFEEGEEPIEVKMPATSTGRARTTPLETRRPGKKSNDSQAGVSVPEIGVVK